MYGVGLMIEFKFKIQRSRRLYIVERFTPIFGIIVVVLITILLDPVLGLLAFVGLFAFVIWALVTVEAVIKLFKEILLWLRPMFMCAKKTVSYFNATEDHSPEIQDNGFAGTEENNLARENALPELNV